MAAPRDRRHTRRVVRFLGVSRVFTPLRRVAAAVLLLPFLVVAVGAPAGAQTTPVGVGTGTGNSSLLSIDLGSLLQLNLINEASSGTIDPANGVPTAFEQLQALSLQSSTLPALGDLTLPLVETRTTGGQDSKTTSLLDLSTLPSPVSGLLSGQINPATLSSIVSSDGAVSSLTSTLDNLALLGGVVKTSSASADLGSFAKSASANAGRSLGIDQLTALDLGGLLQLLGISLDQLPVDTLTGLVGQLGLPLDAVNQATGLDLANLTDLGTTIDGLQTTITGLLANTPVCNVLDPILVQLGLNCTDTTATLTSALDSLTSALTGVLGLLDSTALLSVDALQVGQLASATDTVAGSQATTTGSIGHLRVGGIDLGAVDLNQTVDQLTALAAQVTSTVNGILGTIDPALGNLIDVKLFDRSASVAQDSGYVNALSAITALLVTINPPDVCSMLGDLANASTVGTVIDSLGGQVPTDLPVPVSDLLGTLGSTVDCSALQPAALAQVDPNGIVSAITDPLTIKALSVSGAAAYVAPPAPVVPETPAAPAAPTLPLTGGDSTLLLLAGAAFAAGALALRRLAGRRI